MAVNPMMQGVRVSGLNSALKGMNQAAQDVAELNVDNDPVARTKAAVEPSKPAADSANAGDDRAEALVSLKLYQREAQAAAKVVVSADAVLGFLLDVHA